MNDLLLMEAEADIYKSIEKLSHYHNSMSNTVHLVNFSSHDESDIKFLSTFYRVLVRTRDAQNATINLFETICTAHGHQLEES